MKDMGINSILLERTGEVRDAAAVVSIPKRVGKRLFATVGQADVVGRNGRIYPRSEWARVVDRANRIQCPAGMLGGAVDHVEVQHAGNLRDKCLLWRALRLEADGAVTGEFEIVADHDRGRNLLAWIKAGGAVGFSTYGSARAREPDAAECEKYGLDHDHRAVVVEGWELIAIDAVDNPSFKRSWMRRESVELRPQLSPEKSIAAMFADRPAGNWSGLHAAVNHLFGGK
jgi:hypothetical protein